MSVNCRYVVLLSMAFASGVGVAQTAASSAPPSHVAGAQADPGPRSAEYQRVQQRLARGWNTWDVHSVATQVLLPEGLAIHVGLKSNATSYGDEFLGDALIGRLSQGAEVVTPGPHSWDGSYTSADYEWKGHKWRVQSAHDGNDLVMLVEPLSSKAASVLPPTVVFSVNFLWNRPRSAMKLDGFIVARTATSVVPVYCTCSKVGPAATEPTAQAVTIPIQGPFFATDLTGSVGVSTGKQPRTLDEIEAAIARQKDAYETSLKSADANAPILDAIETTLGWDTIYEPEKGRVISPVSRVWSVNWGGYVLFDWDTFFAATLAAIGDKDLAYADALETLREETPAGFVPNFARSGNWKSADRSEPPVGAITVLGLFEQFRDRWFIEDAFEPLLRWNRWWSEHRDLQSYITLGSDGDNQPINLLDTSRGTWQGAIYESGLDNSPMYDGTVYNKQTHLLEYADVGMTSMYIADCDALAQIATVLNKAG